MRVKSFVSLSSVGQLGTIATTTTHLFDLCWQAPNYCLHSNGVQTAMRQLGDRLFIIHWEGHTLVWWKECLHRGYASTLVRQEPHIRSYSRAELGVVANSCAGGRCCYGMLATGIMSPNSGTQWPPVGCCPLPLHHLHCGKSTRINGYHKT